MQSGDDELVARLMAKYCRSDGLCGLFGRMVDEDDAALKPLVRAKAVLRCAAELSDQALRAAVQHLPPSAAAVRERYKSLYKDASRVREEGLRRCKTRELVCLIVVRLEHLARQKRDPVDAGSCSDLVAMFEGAAMLLTSPSTAPLLDLVDFCWDTFGRTLGATLIRVWEELEVEAHSRAPTAVAESGAEEKEAVVAGDKKRIKTELAVKAVEVMQVEQERARKRLPLPQVSLGSIRKKEQIQKKAADTAVPQPRVIINKVKVKKKSPMKKKI
jgi:hypothetical protein